MADLAPETGWRGWRSRASGDSGVVTSERLQAGAGVRNRWFPKIHSWFALGAPLELLSPLSIARPLAILTLLVVSGSLVPAVDGRRAWLLVDVAISLVWVIWVMRVRAVGPRPYRALTMHVAGMAGAIAWADRPSVAPVIVVMLLVPNAAAAGLFLGAKPLLLLQKWQLLAIGVGALLGGHSLAGAALITLGTLVTTTTMILALAVTMRAARHRGTIDADIGIPNGFGLANLLAARVPHGRFTVAAIVLRGLPEAREALGHGTATELLRRVVEDLGQVVPNGALIGRVDAGELIVAVDAEAHPLEAGPALARLLHSTVAAGSYLLDGIETSLRAHVGLAQAPADGTHPNELMRRASLAARQALAEGKPFRRWDGDAGGALTADDLSLLADLRNAGDRGELWMAYQPQVDTARGVVAVEALLRWDHPTFGLVPPGRFIPLAERTGFIDRLDEWVLNTVLDTQVAWRHDGLEVRVAVNLSPLSLADPALPTRILRALADRDLPSDALVIEITETAPIDLAQAIDRLRGLHDDGIRISIDDFGTGYTSLALLPHLPIDELKVDQRFVLASSTSEADNTIVEAVRQLAHRLGLDAVAEGVEDEITAARLSAMGFDAMQGFHFAMPLTADELRELMAATRAAATD